MANEKVEIDTIGQASTINGASILGITAAGETALFKINDIKGDYKGLADPAINYGVPVLQQKYDLKAGVTYPFLGGIAVPLKVGTQYVVNPTAIWSGTAWVSSWGLMDAPAVPDVTTIPVWTAIPFIAGAFVTNAGRVWKSNKAASATNIPVVGSTVWDDMGSAYQEEIEKKVSTRNIKETRIFDSSDRHNFADGSGKVMFTIDANGSKSMAYRIYDRVTKALVGSLDATWFTDLVNKLSSIARLIDLRPAYKTDGHYFTDSTGKLMFKATAAGLQAFKFLDRFGAEVGAPPKKAQGKFVFSLGDSHTIAPWLAQFCTDTGSTYDPVMQSTVSANQVNYNDPGLMMASAKALKQYTIDNSKTLDIILIENCHFLVSGAVSDYVPMNYENFQLYGTIYASQAAMTATIAADKMAFVATLTPTLKTALRFRFNTVKETIAFTSAGVLTAGTAVLTIDGNNFALNVTAGMTLMQAITALNDWAFDDYLPNWSNLTTKGLSRPAGTIELVYKGSVASPAEPTITFNAGTTGMVMSTHGLSSVVSYQDYYYNSLKLSDWNTNAKWIGTNGTVAYPAMMGLLEYLQVSFPTAEIIVWSVQSLSISTNKADANSFQVEKTAGSGTYYLDVNAYYLDANTIRYRNGQIAMREVAVKYGCRFLDVDTQCGISILNMFSAGYFGSNNLHPFPLGYQQWGRTLAKLY